jgi:hypothetical protein
MDFNKVEEIKDFGFKGFKTIKELINDPDIVPNQMGIYMILYPTEKKVVFLDKGVGGFFKGKDPNVSIAKLEDRWINSKTVYIGATGGKNKSGTLKRRVKQLLRFGQGENVGHYGGRIIWQLKNHLDLVVCWMPTEDEPMQLKKTLLKDFQLKYDQKPFANLA